MIVSIIIFVVIGIIEHGGMGSILEVADKGERLELFRYRIPILSKSF